MDKEREREDTSGIMDKFSRENGKKVRKMAMEFGSLRMEIHTKVIG